MKIRVNDIPEEGFALSEQVDPARMQLETPELKFTAPLRVTASFHKEQETIWVEVGVDGQTEQVCGRCLAAYARPYGNRFQLDYSTEGILELDVTDDVRQEILLSYPIQCLCREDCRGLCPQCGANLNERSCLHAAA